MSKIFPNHMKTFTLFNIPFLILNSVLILLVKYKLYNLVENSSLTWFGISLVFATATSIFAIGSTLHYFEKIGILKDMVNKEDGDIPNNLVIHVEPVTAILTVINLSVFIIMYYV